MFYSANPSINYEEIKDRLDEAAIISYYLNIPHIPCFIKSPLREDNNPSFGIYNKGKRIYWVDMATGERGGIYDLLSQLWEYPFNKVIHKVYQDFILNKKETSYSIVNKNKNDSNIVGLKKENSLQCRVREWRPYDIEYWKSYGISLEWLKYAEVYPISHKIIVSNGKRHVFAADKFAYAFVERKEGNVTIKIYQPFNTRGYKWSNKHDRSVISLWTKIPEKGEKVVICSSLKDALCLWSNTSIPAIAVQGEGYSVSDTAIAELKRRYKEIYVLFDNDGAGLLDGRKLSKNLGVKNLVLPKFNGGKDVSDLYKIVGKKQFLQQIKQLFN